MKKLLVVAALALSLGAGGCAQIQTAYDTLAGINVTPTQIIVAANSFDAVQATATQYLLWCKSIANAQAACALATRQKVVAAVRSGRAARAQLEPYISNGVAGPMALYQTLIAAVTTLQNSTPVVSK